MLKRIFFLILFPTGMIVGQQPVKALWVVRDILKSKTETDKMLEFVKEAGITDLLLQVRGRGDAYYSSMLAPRAEDLPPGWDPLRHVSDQLRGSSVRLHAWLNVYYIWSADRPPRDSSHLFFKRPQWAAVSRAGQSMSAEGVELLKKKGLEGLFISPAEEDFKIHFIDIVRELVTRYRLDGVHLDYVRYPAKDYDFSPAMRSKFLLSYHREPPASENSNLQALWAAARKNEVSALVASIKDTLRQIDNTLKLSAAVWADLRQADDNVFQDWPRWVTEGYVDFVVLMNYAVDDALYERRLSDAQRRIGSLARVISGISTYNQELQSAERKVSISRRYGLMGISFFSYETVRTDRSYREFVRQTRFP